jgi:radical SAM superfamily enzyme YgiQ (UPF0313 family)
MSDLKPLSMRVKENNKELLAYVKSLRNNHALEKKVLFVQAPQFLFNSINIEVIKDRGYYCYPPTGLQSLAAAVDDKEISIDIFDLNYHLLKRIKDDDSFDYHDWLQLLADELERLQPSVVGVTCLSVYSDLFDNSHPLTEILRFLMARKSYIVMAGGPTATNEIDNYLMRDICHFVIGGEGEKKINYLFDVLFNDQPRSACKGIYFRDNSRVLESAGEKSPVSLQGNLIKTYKNIPIKDYCRVGSLNPYSRMIGQDVPYGVVQLHRGCRSNCSFCGVRAFMGKGIRTHRVDQVINEIEYQIKEHGIRHFEVLDDDFLANQNAVRQLLTELVLLRKQYQITWSANNGMVASSLTHELLSLMRDSGCLGFKIGIESGSRKMLIKIRKPGNISAFIEAAERLNEYPELFVGGNYIIGFFGEETFGQLMETFKLAIKLNFDWSSYTIFQFTSRANCLAENLKTDGSAATDFIPSKNASSRDVWDDSSLSLGKEVFEIDHDIIPGREQLKNIWLTFNLVSNYINNKNLSPGANPLPFIKWLEAVRICYPQNPYMYFFTGLGYTMMDNPARASLNYERTKSLINEFKGWQHRFEQFGILDLILNPPVKSEEAHERLAQVRELFKFNDPV